MPKHHDDHEWIFNSEGYLAPYRAAELFKKLAEDVLENSGGKLSDVDISLPEEVYATVRYERKPKGELVLKAELHWRDGSGGRGQHPISQFLS
jgi:hypothetical protein